jgi:hypothetical protein
MRSTVQRSFTRFVAPVVLVALLAVLVAWQGGVRAAEGRAAAGGDGTSIAVHGDWTVDVYAADGQLVEQRAFSNALATTGAWALAEVLSGSWELIPSEWRIAFDCGYGVNSLDDRCWIESADAAQFWQLGTRISEGLEVDYVEGEGGFALRGTAVAPQDFTLTEVTTWLGRRNRETGLPSFGTLTQKRLPGEEQIEVMEGQSIVIRVELSFS